MIYAYFSESISTPTHEILSSHFERIVLFMNERLGRYKYHEFEVQ